MNDATLKAGTSQTLANSKSKTNILIIIPFFFYLKHVTQCDDAKKGGRTVFRIFHRSVELDAAAIINV